jgi:hypothetical protein
MQATEIIDRITSAGGRIWLEQDKVRAHLPEPLCSLVSVIHLYKPELMAELARCPSMPVGFGSSPGPPRMRLSNCRGAQPSRTLTSSSARRYDKWKPD